MEKNDRARFQKTFTELIHKSQDEVLARTLIFFFFFINLSTVEDIRAMAPCLFRDQPANLRADRKNFASERALKRQTKKVR